MEMNLITNDCLTELLGGHQPPCLSLYQPTHRHHPENQQDPIRFRNLVKELEESLLQNLPKPEVVALLQPFEALAQDHEFWNHTLDGLAVFGGPGTFRTFGLQRAVEPLVIVAESYHTKPLRRFLQSTDRYQVLALSRDHVRLFAGNRNTLDEVDLAPGVPRTLTEALGEELTEPHQTIASYGSAGHAVSHGHGGQKDESEIDTPRFFRAIDRAVLTHHSKPSGLPLILAALPEYHGLFRQISHNSALLSEGIKIDPEALGLDQLRERAWKIMEPEYQSRLAGLAEAFAVSKSKGIGLEDLAQVAEAAFAGRVATLLVEADREVAGRIHAGSGNLHFENAGQPQGDDLLDDLGELVLKRGGRVFVLPSGRMPTDTGAAASCRF